MKKIITATDQGLQLPAGHQLAIIKDGKVLASGQVVAEAAFHAAGTAYLAATEHFLGTNATQQIKERVA